MDRRVMDNLMDDYLMGKMSEDQIRSFEEWLDSDHHVRERVAHRRLILKALRLVSERELKRKLQNHDRYTRRRRVYWLAAAVLVIGISLTSYFIYNSNSQRLNLAEFDFYEEGIPNYMGIVSDRNFQKGMSAFRNEEYESAVGWFRKMNGNDTTAYYEGVASYRIGNYEYAELCFQRIGSASGFRMKADFRVILTLLEQGDYTEASSVMNGILGDSTHLFFDETKRLKSYIEHK